ncbi:cytochrome P450 [Novosphingobium tardum]|uniref:cytochrome P450 n=1 Tax=Novosphingobium tardum TaxID=1538021 RepID=UPI0036D34651
MAETEGGVGQPNIDLFDPATQEDWYPAYRELRDNHPVYRLPGSDLYVLTRYEDIMRVVRDPKLFSVEHERLGGDLLIKHEQAREFYRENGLGKETGVGRWSPLSTDPPRHRKYRDLVDRFFQGRALLDARPLIEQLVDELIDGFVTQGEVEVVSAFAEPLPVTVITSLLGLPLEDIPQLRQWSAAWAAPFARGLSLEQEMEVARQGVDFQNYIRDVANERRRNPREDIITHLVQARYDDERPLTDHEIASIVDHLYIGGNETTTFAIASGLWLMLREAQIYKALIANPSQLPTFAEEVLRLESPTQGLYRTASADTEIRGVPISKGATIHMRFAAANRDEAVFAHPDKVDLGRKNASRHLAFSKGEHHCPGAALSRLEQVIAYERLLERLPNLRLTPGANDFTHWPGFVLRALRHLHVSFD